MKIGMKIMAFTICIITLSSADDDGWVEFAQNENHEAVASVYLKSSKAKTITDKGFSERGVIQTWMKVRFNNAKRNMVHTQKMELFIDCKESEVGLGDAFEYNRSGKLITNLKREQQIEMSSPIPDSFPELLLRAICNSKEQK